MAFTARAPVAAGPGGSLSDGDYGDVIVGGGGTTMSIDGAYTTARNSYAAGQAAAALAAAEAYADAGDADLLPKVSPVITTGPLTFPAQATPSTPSAGFAAFYARARAGRVLPHWIGPSGIDFAVQPALFGNSIVIVSPAGSSTGVSALGGTISVGATGANPAISSGSFLNWMRRHTSTTTNVAGNAAGLRTAYPICGRGESAGFGGFFFYARVGMVTYDAAMQIRVGLANQTALLGGDPSAQNNTFCFGKDTADTTWKIITRDNAGGITKVDTLLTPAAGQVFDVGFFCKPNDSQIIVRVERLDSASVLLDDVPVSANLPLNTSPLALHSECRTNAAVAVSIAMNKLYVETDV